MAARQVMDIKSAAAYLGVSADTLYQYAKAGIVPAFRLGGLWRFPKQQIDAWMNEKAVENSRAAKEKPNAQSGSNQTGGTSSPIDGENSRMPEKLPRDQDRRIEARAVESV